MEIIFLIFLLILSCFSLVITESFAVRQVHHSSELSAEHHDTLKNTISNLKSDMVTTPYNNIFQSNTVYGLQGSHQGQPPNAPRNYWIPSISNGNNITFGDKDNEHQEYSNSLNEAQTNLETSLKSLDSMFKDTLEYTEKINSRCMQNYNLILDMNNRVSTAKKYFNLVMNQNQGAIGELDINEYNRNQAIFENLVLITVLLIVIYLYFKNSN